MTVDAFMRRVGAKYPWLHPDYDPDDSLWQMRAAKARQTIASAIDARRGETGTGSIGEADESLVGATSAETPDLSSSPSQGEGE